MKRFAALLLIPIVLTAVERRPVVPSNAPKAIGPFTPGIMAGNYLYVSGQGARKPDGTLAAGIEGQIAQSLENLRTVVQAAGLRLENVIYADVYLADVKNYDLLNKVWAKYFPKNPPARNVIGVRAMPTATPVEVNAIAVRNLALRQAATVPAPRLAGAPVTSGVLVDNRFYLGGVVGRDFAKGTVPPDVKSQVTIAIARAAEILRSVKLELRHLAAATIFIDAEMPMETLAKILTEVLPSETAATVVRTTALPFGAHFALSGVASRNLRREGHCTSIAETVYCPARAGAIGTALRYVKQDLEAAKSSIGNVVSALLFVDQIDNYNEINKIYGSTFAQVPPARTTVQPSDGAPVLTLAPGTDQPKPDDGPQVQLATVAVR